MFRAGFVSGFILSVAAYAVFAWLYPAKPLGPAEMVIIFAIGFGSTVLLAWILKHLHRKGVPHAQ